MKYTSRRFSVSGSMVPAVTAPIANTPYGVSSITKAVMRTMALFQVRSGASRRSRSSSPIRPTPIRQLNRTTAGTTFCDSEANGFEVK